MTVVNPVTRQRPTRVSGTIPDAHGRSYRRGKIFCGMEAGSDWFGRRPVGGSLVIGADAALVILMMILVYIIQICGIVTITVIVIEDVEFNHLLPITIVAVIAGVSISIVSGLTVGVSIPMSLAVGGSSSSVLTVVVATHGLSRPLSVCLSLFVCVWWMRARSKDSD